MDDDVHVDVRAPGADEEQVRDDERRVRNEGRVRGEQRVWNGERARGEKTVTEDTTGDDETRDRGGTESGDSVEGGDGAEGITLESLPETYATDVIVFEWLTDLVRAGGTASALRAVSYYAEVGWIANEVKVHLERVLSGPDLDIHVDPTTTPPELTAEDHADSYAYIRTLREVHQAKREVAELDDAE
ncbi:FlaD/FlaE family flagellar protein [Natrialbaceae archaeon GCM10025810]|uniref:FlaD/FlaE family flagellar protein n=1 Tax=Halovalidus salilacus TaxID=3075124 RepID=UPI00360EAE1E